MDNLQENTQFLFYSTENGKIAVQVIADALGETIWTTQKGMSEIFGVESNTITYHLKEIYQSGELQADSTARKIRVVQSEGKREVSRELDFYNLDVIIAVGYRVNSYQATRFRIWATKILKEYLIKGFSLDDERLKKGGQIFNKDYFQELLERIREIRASERMFYEKITDLYRDCSIDYDKDAEITRIFYKTVQNKFHYAIHQHTAPELIMLRANADKDNMGLTNWKNEPTGGKIMPSDVTTAKCYLTEAELKGLNRLVTMFLDYAENLVEKRSVLKMEDWARNLDAFIRFYDYPLLPKLGMVKKEVADRFAKQQYEKFRVIQDKRYKSDFNKLVEATKNNAIPVENVVIENETISAFDQSLKTALDYNPKDE